MNDNITKNVIDFQMKINTHASDTFYNKTQIEL